METANTFLVTRSNAPHLILTKNVYDFVPGGLFSNQSPTGISVSYRMWSTDHWSYKTETFSVDPNWLSAAPVQSNRKSSTLTQKLHEQEKNIEPHWLKQGKNFRPFPERQRSWQSSSNRNQRSSCSTTEKNQFKPE